MNLSGLIAVDVTQNAHFAADTFRAEFATSAMTPGYGPEYWSRSDYDRLELAAWLDGDAGLARSPLITGQVDEVEIDPTRRRLTLSGRDLSAALIDAKTSEKFQNLRPHEIARTLAARRGLDSDVTATKDSAGKFYEIDHAALTREQSEWDLLSYLAEREGFDLWVRGETLFFHPPAPESQSPYEILWRDDPAGGPPVATCTGLTLSRSQTLARDVEVTVRSWNQASETSFSVTYRSVKKGRSEPLTAPSQSYSYAVANLTREQALKYAQTMAVKITRHERVISCELPGDLELDARSVVRLAGTGTDFDQIYYPESVTRRIAFEEGFTMSLRAKNHSPRDTVLIWLTRQCIWAILRG